MRVNQPVRSSLRRLVALLVVLAMAAGGAFVGWNQTTDTYQSTASVVVVPASGSSSVGGDPDNPLTGLDDSIAQLALVVSAQLDAAAVREQVVAAGGDGSYVADTRGSQGGATAPLSAVIKLTATGPTSQGSQRATRVLVTQASDQLASVQSAANVPSDARAKVITITPAAAGVEVAGRAPWQSAVILGAAAAVAALLLIVVGKRLARGRGRPTVASTASGPREAPVQEPAAVPAPTPGSAPARRRVQEDEGRFAPPSEVPAGTRVVPGSRRRQEMLRDMVREDWQRSGSNVPWTRREQRDAYERAEQRLADRQRRLHDLEIENVRGNEDLLGFRDHG